MAEVEVRALGPDDVDAMVDLDEQSGYEVYDEYADWVEDEDEENSSLWGVFADDELVGFCVTGGSDDPRLPDAVTEHPLNKYLGTFLSLCMLTPTTAVTAMARAWCTTPCWDTGRARATSSLHSWI